MGTSINQPSPRSLLWTAVAAAYDNDILSTDRLLREIWRAARSEPGADVRKVLASGGVLACMHVAVSAATPVEAAGQALCVIAEGRTGSVAADIARRAAILSAREDDRPVAFAQNLFVQMTDYLVSRDLPGHIGEHGRAKTVSEAAQLKDALRGKAAELVSGHPPPAELDAAAWHRYVVETVERLAK